jgi:hypothetical protein
MKPQFSLIAPSIRPQLWSRFCDSLSNVKLNLEIIFVGPLAPICPLPSNFRWIEATVKPSQCTHIGFIEAQGEIVSLTADDALYFSPIGHSAIDEMYNFIKNFPDESYKPDPRKLIYGFRMFEDSFCSETSLTHRINFVNNPSDYPLLYPFFAMYKSLYSLAGEYDYRFITGQAENDFQLRVAYFYGNTTSTLCPTAMVWANHDLCHDNKGKFRDYHAIDSKTLKDMWWTPITKNDPAYGMGFHMRQIREVQKYENNNTLYTISQGNKGEWI